MWRGADSGVTATPIVTAHADTHKPTRGPRSEVVNKSQTTRGRPGDGIARCFTGIALAVSTSLEHRRNRRTVGEPKHRAT